MDEYGSQRVGSGSGAARRILVILGVIFAGMAAVVVIAVLTASPPTSQLQIVNSSSEGPLDIFLDGKLAMPAVPPTQHEDLDATRHLSVSLGTHTLEAKNAGGKVVDTQTAQIGYGAYLYAPAHSPKTCFVVQSNTYGKGPPVRDLMPLDPKPTFWKVPGPQIDIWWEDTPQKIEAPSTQTAAVRTTMRQITCGDPKFRR